MVVRQLRVNYMGNPVGFDFEKPVFGWITEEAAGKRQTAYQAQVSLCDCFCETVYDSGRVESDASVCVELPLTLAPRTRYFWRVRVWDDTGAGSDWSEPAYFETARYAEKWNARWIGMDGDGYPQLRKGFSLDKPVKRARVYATAAGVYCLFVNGRRVGDDVLAPFINAYDQWIQYETYDITGLLRAGGNAVGAWIGNGYYAGRVNWPGIPTRVNLYGREIGLFAELIVEFEDGSVLSVGTDETWKASPSPFLRSEIYDGEYFDARKVLPGWCEGGFDDTAWANARLIEKPKGALEARRSVPLGVRETRACGQIIITPAGETVLDFGQNMAGWVRFKTNAPAGTELLLQAGEVLDKHGNFYRDNMRTALAETRYICRGGGEEYAPFMTFFGFRYMRLTGFENPAAEDFKAEVVYSKMERTGYFDCSDERVNRLFLNALWGQKSNFVDVPTDCPQRDERMGWTGDAQVFCATACLNMDADAFYRKFLYDLYREQKVHGYVPVVIPFFILGSGKWEFPTTGWGDAATIMPWDLYLYYGDRAALRDQFDSMKRWVDYMTAQDTLGVDRYYGFHLGDWLAQDTADPFNLFGATPTELIATAYYAYSARLTAKAAGVLGERADERKYTELYQRVRDAFRKEFMTPNGRVLSETQTAQVVALYMGLCDENERAGIAERLAKRIRDDKCLLSTGFIGTPYLCPVLSENGYNEYAYELLLSTGRPSWLYAVERGATTIWERWNGIDENGDFGPVSMNSFNHYAYGSIAEWLYRYCTGLNPVEGAPGFKKARVAPMPSDRMDYARAAVETQYGRLSCGWKLEGDLIAIEIEVPFNTTAEIILPDAEGVQVTENGQSIEGARLERGAGRYIYAYKPTFKTISRRVVPDVLPNF